MSQIIDPTGEVESYIYDNEQQLSQMIDRNGVVTTYEYNIYGALRNRRVKGEDLYEKYTYTQEGLIKTASTNEMLYNYTYDVMGRVKANQQVKLFPVCNKMVGMECP